jgi:hypothetical protein
MITSERFVAVRTMLLACSIRRQRSDQVMVPEKVSRQMNGRIAVKLNIKEDSVIHLLIGVGGQKRTSSISAMNVDSPRACESPAPTRAKIVSTNGSVALVHGTKLPT